MKQRKKLNARRQSEMRIDNQKLIKRSIKDSEISLIRCKGNTSQFMNENEF